MCTKTALALPKSMTWARRKDSRHGWMSDSASVTPSALLARRNGTVRLGGSSRTDRCLEGSSCDTSSTTRSATSALASVHLRVVAAWRVGHWARCSWGRVPLWVWTGYLSFAWRTTPRRLALSNGAVASWRASGIPTTDRCGDTGSPSESGTFCWFSSRRSKSNQVRSHCERTSAASFHSGRSHRADHTPLIDTERTG